MTQGASDEGDGGKQSLAFTLLGEQVAACWPCALWGMPFPEP